MEGSFDHWTSIFLLVTGTGIFLFFILLSSKNVKKSNFPIAFVVLLFSLTILQYVLFWTKHNQEFPYLDWIPSVTYFAVGPLLYFYFIKIFNQPFNKHFIWHFLPVIGIVIPQIMVWIYYLSGVWFWGELGESILSWRIILFDPYLQMIHMTVYSGLLWWMIFKRKKKIENETDQVLLNWSSYLAQLNVLFIGALLSYYILVNFPFFNRQWDYMICLTMSFSIYTIGFFVFKQPAIFNGELLQQFFLPKKMEENSLIDTTMETFYQNLLVYLEREKPFFDAELRLTSLADQLGYSSHLLSQIINEKSGKNFNQFINDFRLVEAEKLLKGTHELSIKDIYYQVGFNNKATFYQVFKKKHQDTPSSFRKTHLQKNTKKVKLN